MATWTSTSTDPIGDALWWYPMQGDDGRPPAPRPVLPRLGPQATADDRALYGMIEQAYNEVGNPGTPGYVGGEDIVNAVIGRHGMGVHRDPLMQQFVAHQQSNALVDPGNQGILGNLLNSQFADVLKLYAPLALNGVGAGTSALSEGLAGGTEAGALGTGVGAGSSIPIGYLAPEVSAATMGTTTPATGGGLFASWSPYATGTSHGLKVLSAATGNKELGAAGSLVGLGGGMAGGDWGSIGDWIGAAGTAAGLGNMIYGQLGASKTSGKANDAVDLQAQLAEQLFNDASPVRQANMAQFFDFANTGQLPIGLRTGLDALTTTGRQGLEGQYNAARENIIRTTPRGGQLTAALNALEASRAASIGRLGADVLGQYELPMRQNVFQIGTNAGLGQGTVGLQGVGNSAANFLNLAQAASQQAGAGGQAAGGMLALLLRQLEARKNPTTGADMGYTPVMYQSPAGPGLLANETPWYAMGNPLGGSSYT